MFCKFTIFSLHAYNFSHCFNKYNQNLKMYKLHINKGEERMPLYCMFWKTTKHLLESFFQKIWDFDLNKMILEVVFRVSKYTFSCSGGWMGVYVCILLVYIYVSMCIFILIYKYWYILIRLKIHVLLYYQVSLSTFIS